MGRFRRRAAVVLPVAVALFALAAVSGAPTEAWANFKKTTTTASATYSSGTLAAPTSLHCTSIIGLGVDLAWTAPTGVTTPSLLRYTVKRKQGAGAYSNRGTNLTTTTFHDTGVLGSFDYVVSASYQSWTGPNSGIDTVTFAAITSLCSA